MKTESKKQAILNLAIEALYNHEISVNDFRSLQKVFGNIDHEPNPARVKMPASGRKKPRAYFCHKWEIEQFEFIVHQRELRQPNRSLPRLFRAQYNVTVSEGSIMQVIRKIQGGTIYKYAKWNEPSVRSRLESLQRRLQALDDQD